MRQSIKTVNVTFSYRFKALFETSEKVVSLDDKATIRDLLAVLCDTEVKRKGIYGSDGDLRHDVMLTRNGLFIFYLNRLDTHIENGDTVNVFYPASMG